MASDDGSPTVLETLLEGLLGDEGVDVLDDVTTEDVTFEAVTGETYEGREIIKDVLAESMAAYEAFDLEIEWTVAEDDHVVASTRTTAKTERGILGIPPPEDTRTIDTIFDARLEDGRIAYLRQVFDTRQMMPIAVRRGRGAIFEQMHDGVIVLDDSDLVVDANAAALELLAVDREDVLGDPIESVIDVEETLVDAGAEPVPIERDGRTYEIRSSPIEAESDEPMGHALVARDVTDRERRTRRLAEQRDELERLSEINGVLRGVNQALVGATSRPEIDRAVADRLAVSDLYEAACVADVQTWTGEADGWTVAGDRDPTGLTVPELARPPAARSDGGASVRRAFEPANGPTTSTRGTAGDAGGTSDDTSADDPGTGGASFDTWTVVPLVYGTTVYGALGLCTDRATVGDRERSVLLELGETIGHAINAAETRRLLSAEATVALAFASSDGADPLVAAIEGSSSELELDGLIPAGERRTVAYLRIEGDDPASVAERLASADGGSVRTVHDDDDEWVVEWTIDGEVPLGTFVESGANVLSATVADGRARYGVEVASDADVRSLVDRVRRRFPDVEIVSKEERSGRSAASATPDVTDADLTPRQREVLEAAYRSGYFGWPRDSTAEEVAESLGVAASTLHSHLRKAEATLLDAFFEDESAGT